MRSGAGSPIVQERVIEATPDEVFAAWSDPASLGVWMCPGEMSSASVELDFRVGGRFRIVMHGADGDYAQHGEYLEIAPPKRLVFDWVSEWMESGSPRTRVTLTLDATSDGGTRLRLVHDELPGSGEYDGHDEGWASILAKLADRLGAGGTP